MRHCAAVATLTRRASDDAALAPFSLEPNMKTHRLGIIMNGAHTQLRGRRDADAPRVR